MHIEASVLEVNADSCPKLVAGAIVSLIRAGNKAVLYAAGAVAGYQAMEAAAAAWMRLQEEGREVACFPSFTELVGEGGKKTAIELVMEGAKGQAS